MPFFFRTSLLALLIAVSAWCGTGWAATADEVAAAEAQMRALDPRPEAHMTVAELQKRTAAGDLKAQAELGARYGQGYGVKQDIAKAIELLSAAAAKGDPDAQFFLASAYANGLGVPSNELEAFSLYEKAASQGHAGGNYMVASMIIYGRAGISPSWEGGISNLWASATKDYPPAMLLLGAAYQDGKGVPFNPRAAAYWDRRYLSYVQDPRAIFNLRLLINAGLVPYEQGDPGEPPVAVYGDRQAAEIADRETKAMVKP